MWSQRVLANNTLECVVTFEHDVAGIDCDCSDNQLQLTSPTLPALTIAWAAKVYSAVATAKLRKRERMLTVSAPLSRSGSSLAERCVRLRVLRGERGEHVVTFRDPGHCEAATRCYVLVSKSGRFASRTVAKSYSWAATFEAGTGGAVVSLGSCSGAWSSDAPDACITFGRLEDTQTAPSLVEAGRAVDGVVISARPASPPRGAETRGAGAEAREADSVVFLPEREQLPTAALRGACACYDAAYRSICGHEISSRDKQARPPPPRWPSMLAAGGVVTDGNYLSLTYGEACFVPLHRLLAAAGVRQGDVLVDLGSGTGSW